jgi:predicted transposase YbfD/YdcC
VKGETATEVRYVLGDKRAGAKDDALGRRNHGGIENNVPWQLDVHFGEDGSRVHKRTAAEKLGLRRRLTLSLLKAHPSKDSIARKRFSAALDPGVLEEILRGDGILEKR